MGRLIVRVPEGFAHPKDETGEYEPGAHLEPLYYLSEEEKTCFQIYEDVSEGGTPVSPIFRSADLLADWLKAQGNSAEVISQFLEWGHYPSLVLQDETITSLID